MKKLFVLSLVMKRRLLLLLHVSFVGLLAHAYGDESANMAYDRTETTVKSFAATASTSIEIINKYGDINVNTWNKDSVKFEVTITAGAQKMSVAQTLFEMAEVKFTANSSMILATLQWGNNVNAFKRSSVEVSLAAGSGQVLRIDYTIYIPAGNTLKIENRFGNILLPSLTGKTYVSLWHGDLKADKIKNAKNIDVKYGDVDITELTSGELDVSFGDIMIEECGEVFIQATSGTTEIEFAEALSIEATNEKIRIEKAVSLVVVMMLSDLRVRSLENYLSCYSKIGDVDIKDIKANFFDIDIDATNGTVSLLFAGTTSFAFKLNMDKPKSFHASDKFVITDDDTMDLYRVVEGKKGESTVEKLSITTKSCSVNLNVGDQ